MEGQILGNRYELLEKIGGGGMALVYKAKCRLLDRYVAVKILRPEFINDEEFIKRFRVEAQAAASLSHPNIVSIHDVGHEDNIHYIVMEYVNGITLKEYISKKGALMWREAVNIAIQICSAIEQAHRHHIVHRDIKPHNILLTKEGIAKVTDFGIARAVSSSTITMVGSTIGSVHYFSPEQARGGYTDEKSDLYSLGIALYEMVTGKLPFDGDTPVAVALKHIQDQPKEPMEVTDKIPKGLNGIIMKAIKKEQNKRYQSASEMLSDLNRVLKEPMAEYFADFNDSEMPTRKIKAIGEENLIDGEEAYISAKEPKKGKKERLTVWLAIATAAIIMAVCIYIGYNIVIPAILPESNEVTIKNYAGKPFEDVSEELKAFKIQAVEKKVFSDTVPKGEIISQSIAPDQTLKQEGNNVIEFEVSDGPEVIKIPDFRNKESRIVEADLRKLNLIPKTTEEFSETVGKDLVIRTEPGVDEEVRPQTEVIVYKSLGPELKAVQVPSVVGMTKSQAQQAILDAKLKIGTIYPEGTVNDVAKIEKQVPAALTEVNEDTPVDLYFATDIQPTDTNGGEPQTQDPGQSQNQGQGSRYLYEATINLGNPEKYEDVVKVLVEYTPSDTNQVGILINEKRTVDSFPLKIQVPVPEDGKTKVRVLLDNKFYTEFYAPL